MNTIPKELQDRQTYLTMNKDYRVEYEQLKKQFDLWISEVKKKLKSAEENKNDYKNIVSNLEYLKVCMFKAHILIHFNRKRMLQQMSSLRIWFLTY